MLKEIGLMLGGAAVGSLVTYFVMKEKIKDKEEEVEEVRAFYQEKLHEALERTDQAEEAMSEPAEMSSLDKYKEEIGKEKKKVDYTKFGRKKPGGASGVFTEVDPDEDDSVDGNYARGETETVARSSDKNQGCKIIREDQFGERVGYDAASLEYYREDGVLCTEEGEVVDEMETVGDSLDKYGFRDNEEMRIFVRNSRHGCDYEIVKVFARYSDAYADE